jgi:uncharacterized protein (TIGR02145 family)
MVDKSTFKFYSPTEGMVNISIVDMNGKTIYTKDSHLPVGENTFNITGANRGIYTIMVLGKNYTCSSKLMSINDNGMGINVDYISNTKTIPILKNASVNTAVDWQYIPGDRFQYIGKSNVRKSLVIAKTTYGNVATDTTIKFGFFDCVDAGGHSYAIVQIIVGASSKKSTLDTTYIQTWMAENLNVGVQVIGNLLDPNYSGMHNDSVIEKYCYNDSVHNCNIYGGLYTWDEMMQYDTVEGVQGVCPDGWRLPTLAEWDTLVAYFGGPIVAEGSLKETGTLHWMAPNDDATNASGFSARAGGFGNIFGILEYPEGFASLLTDAGFWTSTPSISYPNRAWFFDLIYVTVPEIWRSDVPKNRAHSVRCIHD